MPAYNVEKYIKNAIKSVLNQTYRDWKLIIVDDGSTDTTYQICEKISNKDKRVTLLKNKGKGAFEARLNGIRYCNEIANDEDIITFIDSDDMLCDKYVLFDVMKKIESSDVDILVGGSKKFFGKKISLGKLFVMNLLEDGEYDKNKIINELYLSFFGYYTGIPSNVWSKYYKLKIIKNVLIYERHPHFFADDQFVNLIAFLEAKKVKTIRRCVYLYRIGGNTSKFMPSFIDDMLLMYDFRKSLLTKVSMAQDALLYLKIEYKNLLYFWLLSCLNQANYSDEEMLKEIEKCSRLNQTIDAFSDERVFNFESDKNKKEFILSMIKQDYFQMLQVLKSEPKPPTLFQRAIKKIFR